jgi:thioredoxin 1
MFCIGGVCIPCSVLWPLVLLAIKPVYEFLAKMFGWPSFDAATKKNDKKDCCPFSGKEGKEGETCPGAAAAGKVEVCTMDGKCSMVDASEASAGASQSGTKGNYTVLKEGCTLDQFVGSTERVFLKFTAKWCKPCKEVAPHFEALSEAHPEAQFVSIDIDEFDDYALKYVGMAGIPLFVALDRAGEQLGQVAGKDRAKLSAFVDEHLKSAK